MTASSSGRSLNDWVAPPGHVTTARTARWSPSPRMKSGTLARQPTPAGSHGSAKQCSVLEFDDDTQTVGDADGLNGRVRALWPAATDSAGDEDVGCQHQQVILSGSIDEQPTASPGRPRKHVGEINPVGLRHVHEVGQGIADVERPAVARADGDAKMPGSLAPCGEQGESGDDRACRSPASAFPSLPARSGSGRPAPPDSARTSNGRTRPPTRSAGRSRT